MEFSKAKAMVLPRTILAGHDVLLQLPEVVRDLRLGQRALMVTGQITHTVAGARIEQLMSEAGIHLEVCHVGAADREAVNRAVAAATDSRATFLMGVGGGSKIDVAKLAAARAGLPLVSVPTSAAHDGIASPVASIRDQDKPHSIEAVMPMAIVADTRIIAQAPYRLLASGCADVIANITAVKDWELASRLKNEELSSTAKALAEISARTIMENATAIRTNLEEGAWIAIKPIISSGLAMSIAGSSRPTSGSEHLFAHAVRELTDERTYHGETCGVGAIMMMYLHAGPWEKVRQALEDLGAPTTGAQLGLREDEVIAALTKAHTMRPGRYTILGESGLSTESAKRLATITGVIG